jgi:hypothetical protein
MLDIPEHLKRKGYRQKWCSKSKYEKRLAEGFTPVKVRGQNVTKDDGERTILDGKPLDGTKQLRELILMEMPEELAQSRQKYFKELTDNQLRSATNELSNSAKDKSYPGAGTYGKITIEGGS